MSVQLKPVLKYPIEELEISHSTMESADSCMRKLEFAKLYGFNIYGRSLAADGGNALHAALGVFISTKNKQQATLTLMLKYPIDLCDNPLWKWSLEAAYGALITLMDYFDQHPEIEIATINGKQAIEVPFMINLLHGIEGLMPVKYRGYIDFVLYNRLENEYFVMDLKNTGANITDFTPVYKYSPQCLPYGVVLSAAMGKDFSNLHVQYLISKVDLMNPSVQKLDFYKTGKDIEDWMRDLYMKLVNIKTYIDTKWFPRKSGNCMAYSRPCKFFELCQTRDMKTIKLMLSGLNQPEKEEFIPWITLDLEII